ncbi:EAL domain-containing protein [Pseudomonas sp. nanlin1]|uniref:EAL domain-containing protein n=1 Tax=Pseudomonas sp. nanlin1 TaxID=3040605 RepID=UPI00388E3DAA
MDPHALAEIRSRFATALLDGHVWPAFQPLIHLRTRRISGFEVLARWSDPARGPVPPVDFIPALEDCELIDTLTRYLLVRACREALGWPGDFFLAFNISPVQLKRPGLTQLVCEAVASTGFPLHRLQVEVTEGSLFQDIEAASLILRELAGRGVTVVLDDFGTGFSSLTRLQACPFREMKIDASFIRSMGSLPESYKIVTAIIGLGHSLGIRVVAEGVETLEQEQALKKLGCDLVQGWLYAKAVPSDSARALLRAFGGTDSTGQVLDTSPFQRLHQLNALYMHSPLGLCFIDRLLRCVSANDAFAQLLGRPVAELEGQVADTLLAGLDAGALVTDIVRVLQDGEHCFTELTVGEQCFTLYGQQVVDDAGDVLGVSLVAVDMTERQRAMHALAESEEHFRRTVLLNPTIGWAADPQGVVNYMSPTFTGLGDGTAQQRLEVWRSMMHPDDRDRVRDKWLQWIPSGEPWSVEFRIRWADGSWRWMHSRAEASLHGNGTVERWYGVITDVTDRKLLEIKLLGLENQCAASKCKRH